MPIGPGDTFILTRATRETPHLWVVLWGPAGGADAYLIVSLSTLRGYSDRTVVIRPGEHPFVQHDTCVVYADARRTTAEKLRQAVQIREAIPREPVGTVLLERLRSGLLRSPYTPYTPYTPDAIVAMLRDEFGVEGTG